jgi:hypothetical protein
MKVRRPDCYFGAGRSIGTAGVLLGLGGQA